MNAPDIDVSGGLAAALRRVNALRRGSGDATSSCRNIAEAIMEDLFDAGGHLAVYGSLAPGKPNHGLVEMIRGNWLDGTVRGKLHDVGWGSQEGYPGMTWDPHGDPIPVKILLSGNLADHWKRLDEFEGAGYRRILVPVETRDARLLVANIYEVRL